MSHNITPMSFSCMQPSLDINVLLPLMPYRPCLRTLGESDLVDVLTTHTLSDHFLSIDKVLSLYFEVLVRVHELFLSLRLIGLAYLHVQLKLVAPHIELPFSFIFDSLYLLLLLCLFFPLPSLHMIILDSRTWSLDQGVSLECQLILRVTEVLKVVVVYVVLFVQRGQSWGKGAVSWFH